jgi:hypothetical protein
VLGSIGALLFITSACASESACVDDENGGCLASVRLTYLNVHYDLGQPVYVNNRVPVEFGITSTSPDPSAPATRNEAVRFSIIEADPEDPSAPIECASNALDLQLTGDGQEQVFNGFIWPTTLCEALVGKAVNLRVAFDGGGETANPGIDYPPVTFSEAERQSPLNQACRAVMDPAASDLGRGCVYDFDIQPTPSDDSGTLIDVRYTALAPASSVAVLPYVDPSATGEDLAPSLVVQSTLLVDGRDPYIDALAPEDVPPELEAEAPGITQDLQFGVDPADLDSITAMPGRATLHYELAPADAETGWLPLTIGDPGSEASADRVSEVVIDSLRPGTANTFAHELFAEGDTRAALDEGGPWADVSDFTVRGCFVAEFTQRGNEGAAGTDDCRTIPIVLVRETANASSATAFSFNRQLDRSVGNRSRLGLQASLTTQNRLDRDGVSSRVEGEVDIQGRLGRSFSMTVAHAVGQASLAPREGTASYEISVDAFNHRIYSVSESDPNLVHDDAFSAAKSFSFPGLGFGFGPVRIGFHFRVGGEVRFDTSDSLEVSADGEHCAALLQTSDAVDACGAISRTDTPGFAFTAAVDGGIHLRVVRASVVAHLHLVDTEFPLTASLAWGLGADGSPMVLGDADWQLAMQMIRGDVEIVGRVGFRRWARTLRVNLFRFQSRRFTRTLLHRSLDAVEVLQ